MSKSEKEEVDQLEHRWILLEEQYRKNKPVVARIVDITKGRMIVDLGGIQGHVDHFSLGFTNELAETDVSEVIPSTEACKDELRSSEGQVDQYWERMRGKDIVLTIAKMDRRNHDIELRQRSSRRMQDLAEKWEINSTHNGVVISINEAFVTVDLGGAAGKLPSLQPVSDQKRFMNLSTILQIGQEIEVSIEKRDKNMLFLSLKDQ